MFRDRRDAGRRLALRLDHVAALDPVVVALPRGGVPVAAEVARHLHASLDVIVVRKLGVPWQPELAFGALAEGGVRVLNEELVKEAGITRDDVAAVIARERLELDRRVRAYRGDRPPLSVDDRVVILVDDGLATGYTARAAIEALRRRGARRVILAVPVAPERSIATMSTVADEVVALWRPPWFLSIGEHYEDFGQTSDGEVLRLLRQASSSARHRAG
jgi:putative phosphoribosyl transferase